MAWNEVSFQYIPGQIVLRHVDLNVRPAKKVAIVGRTGAGKSTLLSLLPRFYDPNSGRVTIDGIDIREFQLALRRQIAMVLQPPIVFPLTIRENLIYGRPEATEEEVINAARSRHPRDDCEVSKVMTRWSASKELHYPKVRNSDRLQGLAILFNAPILILDGPTSSVDAETEALTMDGLRELTAGRTTFIAHRLSTVRQADLIIVVRGGRISSKEHSMVSCDFEAILPNFIAPNSALRKKKHVPSYDLVSSVDCGRNEQASRRAARQNES